MNAEHTPQQAALVIKWPQHVPAAAARETARRLVAGRTPATWAVDQVTQIEALTSWGVVRAGAEAALLMPTAAELVAEQAAESASKELARRLELMRSTGLAVDVVHAGSAPVAGHWPRTLRGLGVHAVVVDDARDMGVTRALPFGVWQFTPQATAPQPRRWLSWLRPRRPRLFAPTRSAPAVASVDLTQTGCVGSRGWREMEQAIDQAAEAVAAHTLAIATVGELAGRFAHANAPRPQRSILRSAA
jgi:hypothetical protein